jgi:hypothetical protein
MGRVPRMDDELQMRSWWREWHARMTETPRSDWTDGPRSGAAAA